MYEETLDLTMLKNALVSLKEVLQKLQALEGLEESGQLLLLKEKLSDREIDILLDVEHLRDSCIQRFEYCYDLSIKFLDRHLKNIVDSPDEINKGLPSLIGMAAEKGIVQNSWDLWKMYKDNRNKTSHGYDRAMSIEIVEQIPQFLEEAEYFLKKLEDYYET